jgi:pimeloyl-ACP methyl ester carboxylesterase
VGLDGGQVTAEAKRTRKISRFRNEASRSRFLTAYDATLAMWPTAPAQLDVSTRYGTTHVHSCGSTNGTPVVLLHAVAVSSPSWFANVASLGAEHTVYAVDAIGDAGRSMQTVPIRDGTDMSLWLDDVLAGLGLDRAHLVGLSYGGWLALNQARGSPGRLSSITSVDPPGAFGAPTAKFVLQTIWNGALAKFAKSDKALHRLLRALNNGSLPRGPLLDLTVAGLRTFVARQPFPKRFTDDELRSIRTPTLLLFGEQSPVTPPVRAARRARRLLPGVDVEVIPDVGHALPMEKPEIFTMRALRFIDHIDDQDAASTGQPPLGDREGS